MSISRRLPFTNSGRLVAIQKAKAKKDSTPPSGNFLTTATNDRLETLNTSYSAAYIAVNGAKAVLLQATAEKNTSKRKSFLYTRHYLDAAIKAVEREETGFPPSALAYYGPVSYTHLTLPTSYAV